MSESLSPEEIARRVPDGWSASGDRIEASYTAPSFTAAGALVARLAELADEKNHHPDLALGYPGRVQVVLTSHDQGTVTERDLALAGDIDEVARSAQAEITD